MSDEVAVTMLGRDVPGPSLLDWSHFVMAHWPGIIMCVSWHVLRTVCMIHFTLGGGVSGSARTSSHEGGAI